MLKSRNQSFLTAPSAPARRTNDRAGMKTWYESWETVLRPAKSRIPWVEVFLERWEGRLSFFFFGQQRLSHFARLLGLKRTALTILSINAPTAHSRKIWAIAATHSKNTLTKTIIAREFSNPPDERPNDERASARREKINLMHTFDRSCFVLLVASLPPSLSLSRARSPVHERAPNFQERNLQGLFCLLVQWRATKEDGQGGRGTVASLKHR